MGEGKNLVGVDIGGTKAAIRAETPLGERVLDAEVSSSDWSATPAPAAAGWLAARLHEVMPEGTTVRALGVGAQGCDSARHCEELEAGPERGAPDTPEREQEGRYEEGHSRVEDRLAEKVTRHPSALAARSALPRGQERGDGTVRGPAPARPSPDAA